MCSLRNYRPRKRSFFQRCMSYSYAPNAQWIAVGGGQLKRPIFNALLSLTSRVLVLVPALPRRWKWRVPLCVRIRYRATATSGIGRQSRIHFRFSTEILSVKIKRDTRFRCLYIGQFTDVQLASALCELNEALWGVNDGRSLESSEKKRFIIKSQEHVLKYKRCQVNVRVLEMQFLSESSFN